MNFCAKISESTLDNTEKKKKKKSKPVFVSKKVTALVSVHTLGNLIYDPVVLFAPAELVSPGISAVNVIRDVIRNFINALYKIQPRGLMRGSRRISLFMLWVIRALGVHREQPKRNVVLHISEKSKRYRFSRLNLHPRHFKIVRFVEAEQRGCLLYLVENAVMSPLRIARLWK